MERSLCGVEGLWSVTWKFSRSPRVVSGMVTGPGGSVSWDVVRAIKIGSQRRATRHVPLVSIVTMVEKRRVARS